MKATIYIIFILFILYFHDYLFVFIKLPNNNDSLKKHILLTIVYFLIFCMIAFIDYLFTILTFPFFSSCNKPLMQFVRWFCVIGEGLSLLISGIIFIISVCNIAAVHTFNDIKKRSKITLKKIGLIEPIKRRTKKRNDKLRLKYKDNIERIHVKTFRDMGEIRYFTRTEIAYLTLWTFFWIGLLVLILVLNSKILIPKWFLILSVFLSLLIGFISFVFLIIVIGYKDYIKKGGKEKKYELYSDGTYSIEYVENDDDTNE